MMNFDRKLVAVFLSVHALLTPLGFSEIPVIPSPLPAASVKVTVPPIPAGWRWAMIRRRRRIGPPIHLSAKGEAIRAIRAALRITHKPHTWMHPLEWLAFRESTYNPRAIAYEGVGNQTAQGLFQTLPSTFAAYALPHRRNIWNPVDNTVAAIRYIAWRYGTPQSIPGLETTNYAGY